MRNTLNHKICWCSWKLLRTFWDTNYCNGYYCDNGTLNSSANLSTFYFRPYNILLKIQYIQCTPLSKTTMTNACQNIYLLHNIWTSNVTIFYKHYIFIAYYAKTRTLKLQGKYMSLIESNIKLSSISNEKKEISYNQSHRDKHLSQGELSSCKRCIILFQKLLYIEASFPKKFRS